LQKALLLARFFEVEGSDDHKSELLAVDKLVEVHEHTRHSDERGGFDRFGGRNGLFMRSERFESFGIAIQHPSFLFGMEGLES
jgi:hypothetical protein